MRRLCEQGQTRTSFVDLCPRSYSSELEVKGLGGQQGPSNDHAERGAILTITPVESAVEPGFGVRHVAIGRKSWQEQRHGFLVPPITFTEQFGERRRFDAHYWYIDAQK